MGQNAQKCSEQFSQKTLYLLTVWFLLRYTYRMYIKVTKNSRGDAYYHLVESYRDQGKVRQRTLLSLGKVGEDRLDELAQAISKHKDLMSVFVFAQAMDVKDTYILGPLLIVQHLFSALGINERLKRLMAKHPKLEFDFLQVVFTLVACRFIRPGSKLKVYEHWQEKLYPKLLSVKNDLHHYYRALDLLYEHKEDIEQGLFWHQRDLLNSDIDVVLYDLTTLRFESTREDLGQLRRFGYSKERRSDCTQVVLGLLVDTEGIPLGFEVYPGNTFEGSTLKDIVKRMREKFRVRRFIFVADRGLFSKQNLTHIRQGCGEATAAPGEFIVGMKLAVFKQRAEEFYDRTRFTDISDELAIYETDHEGDRCIITWSRKRAERDEKARADILDKIEKKLNRKKITAKDFVSNTNYRKYLDGLEGGQLRWNHQVITEEAKKDGYFGVISNVATMTAQEIVSAYKNLWIVEDAFGEIKGSLKARPVFHWTDDRIIGHLTLCFIAYYCEAQMTKVLRNNGVRLNSKAVDDGIIEERPLTVIEAMRELAEVRAVPVNVKGRTFWLRTDIKGNAATIFKALGMKIPAKLLTVDDN